MTETMERQGEDESRSRSTIGAPIRETLRYDNLQWLQVDEIEALVGSLQALIP